MLLPVVLFVPSLAYNDYMDKPKMIAKILSLVSFFYYAGMVADIITYNVVGGYVDDGSDPILLKLLWNNIGMMGILFCFIQGTLYLILSKMLRGHKKTVVIMFAVTFIVGAVMPLAYDLYRGVIFTESWYTWFYKNIYFYISQAILLIALIIAASSRWLWSSAFWH